MKKVKLIFLALLIMFVSSFASVFADDYVSSPNNEEKQQELSIEGGTPIAGGGFYIDVTRKDSCIDRVILTPFEYRENIKNDKSYKQLMEAYEQIENCEDLADLDGALTLIANSKGAITEDLAVRYLFDITVEKDFHEETHNDAEHESYVEVNLKAETLEDFVCLMMYKDGNWFVVEEAYVDEVDKTKLHVPVITDSQTYAVVVANDYRYVEGQIGESHYCEAHWVIALSAAVTAYVLEVIFKNRFILKTSTKVLVCVLDIIFSILVYIFFGGCNYDIPVLIINVVVCLVVIFYTTVLKDKTKQKNK